VQKKSGYQGGRCREFDVDQISLVGFPTYALAQISLRDVHGSVSFKSRWDR
jgi:hypothetical protein